MKSNDPHKIASFAAATGSSRSNSVPADPALLQRLVDLLWDAKSDAEVVAAVEDILRCESVITVDSACDVCGADEATYAVNGTERGLWGVECTGVCNRTKRNRTKRNRTKRAGVRPQRPSARKREVLTRGVPRRLLIVTAAAHLEPGPKGPGSFAFGDVSRRVASFSGSVNNVPSGTRAKEWRNAEKQTDSGDRGGTGDCKPLESRNPSRSGLPHAAQQPSDRRPRCFGCASDGRRARPGSTRR